jgi:hypothetical protein
MRKVSKNTAESKKPGTRFGSVAHLFVDANSRYQALAVESVGRAVEIQSQLIGKAYESYVAEASKIGRMFFAGYNVFIPSPRALPPANLNERKAADGRLSSAKAKVNSKPSRRTAAQNMSTKRKMGTVTKTQISKRSAKTKHRSKG